MSNKPDTNAFYTHIYSNSTECLHSGAIRAMILEEWTTEVWHMEFFDKVVVKWNAFCEACKPAAEAAGRILKAIGNVLATIWKYIVKLRKIFLAIPVIWGAIVLALRNLKELPETVGILLEADGTFSFQLARLPAALLPLVLTLSSALCQPEMETIFWPNLSVLPPGTWIMSPV